MYAQKRTGFGAGAPLLMTIPTAEAGRTSGSELMVAILIILGGSGDAHDEGTPRAARGVPDEDLD
jgi:hypothetical protein